LLRSKGTISSSTPALAISTGRLLPLDLSPENRAGRSMTESEIKKIVAETVVETLIRLGVDASNPIEVQKDFQHLRAWRNSINTVQRQGLMTAVGVITVGALGLIWLAITRGPQ